MTNMVQVALAEDVTEAEEIQAILEQAGIASELETAVEHHPRGTEDAPQKVLVPESRARGRAERDRGDDRARTSSSRTPSVANEAPRSCSWPFWWSASRPRAPRRTRTRPGTSTLPIGASFDEVADRAATRGPVSFVRVSFRIIDARHVVARDLARQPEGHRGPARHQPRAPAPISAAARAAAASSPCSTPTCGTNPIAAGAGAVHRQPVPAGGEPGVALRRGGARHVDARGSTNSGRPRTLQCLTLDISRAVPETLSRPLRHGHRHGHVHRAELLLRASSA